LAIAPLLSRTAIIEAVSLRRTLRCKWGSSGSDAITKPFTAVGHVSVIYMIGARA